MNDQTSFKLPATSRIKKRSDFLRIQNSGDKYHCRHFLITALPNELSESRIGVTISKKVDKRATRRNRLKRRIKEIFRLNQHLLANNFDIVVIARKNAGTLEYRTAEREILGALRHNGLFKN